MFIILIFWGNMKKVFVLKNSNLLYLIGLSGCGKTTLSQKLAQYLSFDVYDTDEIIEQQENMSINLIFENYGEEHFRDLESDVLKQMSTKNNAIISTGGGIIKREKNREIIKSSGYTIFIDRDPNLIIENIDTENRPLVKNNKEHLLKLYSERIDFYNKTADVIFKYDKWDSIDDIFSELVKKLMENNLI